MKKFYLINVITVLFVLTTQAQYPCVNGISTNPLNPINNQLPSKKNTFFNWQDSIYQVQPINNDCIRGSQMESPFFKIDNLEELRDSKDMKWDDGWELIRRGFGLTDLNTNTTDPVPNSYLILYNKYTGILRVLLKVCRGADYNAAKITLSLSPLSQIKTDLLEISRGGVSALDKKFIPTSFAAGSKYVNDNTKWFYADFPMMFDPCTCVYKSKLTIISELIATSQISLEGSITGDIYTTNVGGKAQIQQPGSIGWKDFTGFVNGKLSTAHANINTFVSQAQKLADNVKKSDTANGKKNALFNLGNFLKTNQFLKAGLTAVPWLKSALSIVDIFTAGGKTSSGPQEVKLLPLTVNLTAKLNGTITTTNPYHNIIFTNPGSKDAQLDPDAYPYYNEILGIFNLVKTPIIFQAINQTVCDDARRAYAPPIRQHLLRFDADSFYYVLNLASGLTIQNMQGAIMVKTRPKTTDTLNMANKKINTSFSVFEGKDALDSTYKFRTDYFDMKCLDRQIFSHTEPHWKTFCEIPGDRDWYVNYDTVFLKLMINLKRNNTTANSQNVLLVLTYPMKTVTDAVQANTPTFATCDSTILAPASASFVNSFCNSSVYYNLDRQSAAYRDSIEIIKTLEEKGIAISPNPGNGNLRIQIKPQISNLISFKIVDISGKPVYSNNEGNIKLENGFTKSLSLNLRSGTYILIATTTKKILRSKFIIVK
jgi:Secretion system C-terminal sorting domain